MQGNLKEVAARVVSVHALQLDMGLHVGIHHGDVSAETEHRGDVLGGHAGCDATAVGRVKQFGAAEMQLVDVEAYFRTDAEFRLCRKPCAERGEEEDN